MKKKHIWLGLGQNIQLRIMNKKVVGYSKLKVKTRKFLILCKSKISFGPPPPSGKFGSVHVLFICTASLQ